MFARFCNLCHKTTNLQLLKLQRCYRKTSNNKKRSNVRPVKIQENVEGKTPIIVYKRKELNFYEGQTYSKHVPIPLITKGWHHYKSKGDHFFIHPLPNMKDIPNDSCEVETFAQFGFDQQIVDILKKYSLTKPLNIQISAIPKLMNGANTVIAAETGCGKTLAYLLPMINNILTWKSLAKRPYNSPLGLIVTPNRELAFQIGLEAAKICQYLNIRTKTITGGKTKKIMLNPPINEIDILIASFGVISKLTTNGVYKLNMVRHIVLDEADALFEKSFDEKLKVFLRRVPIGFVQNIDDTSLPIAAQFTLASATIPSRMSTVLENIINVESLEHVTSDNLHHILVSQKFIRVGRDDKAMELLKYIKPKIANKQHVIVFSNTFETCNWISMFLKNSNIPTACMNGDMALYDRQGQYANFRSGKCKVLCTTNAGSRGLDTKMVHHILNYDFPYATADYIHRCGRTGRSDNVNDCRVTNFISTSSEISLALKIERAVRKMKPIPIVNAYEVEKNDEPVVDEINFDENITNEEQSVMY